jgi:hypothetical protein
MSTNWLVVFIVGWVIAVAITLLVLPSRCDPATCPPVRYSGGALDWVVYGEATGWPSYSYRSFPLVLAQTSGCMPTNCPPPKCEAGVCR